MIDNIKLHIFFVDLFNNKFNHTYEFIKIKTTFALFRFGSRADSIISINLYIKLYFFLLDFAQQQIRS